MRDLVALSLVLCVCLSGVASAGTVRIEERPFPDHEHLLFVGLSSETTTSTFDGRVTFLNSHGDVSIVGLIPRARFVRAIHVDHGRLIIDLETGIEVKTRSTGKGVVVDLRQGPPNSVSEVAAGTLPKSAAIPVPAPLGSAGALPSIPAPFLASVEGAVSSALGKAGPSASRPKAIEPVNETMSASDVPKAPAPAPAPSVAEERPAASSPSNGTPTAPRTINLPFAGGVGAALRQDGCRVLVVFDEERPVDQALFSGAPATLAQVIEGSNSTTLAIEAGPSIRVGLGRGSAGWFLTLASSAPLPRPVILHRASDAAIAIEVDHPGLAVAIRDPFTGHLFLVGTVLAQTARVAASRSAPLFVLHRSELGIVVEPLSDHVVLRRAGNGFQVTTDDLSSLHVGSDFLNIQHREDRFSTVLHMPAGSIPALNRRLEALFASSAASPTRDRSTTRIVSAEVLLSLGLAREAGTRLAVAEADDPQLFADPKIEVLRTMIKVLDPSAMPPESGPEHLDPTHRPDDETFWSALADRSGDQSVREGDADRVRRELDLFLSYTAPLQTAAVGQVAETLLRGGSEADFKAVTSLPTALAAALPRAIALDRLQAPRAAEAILTGLEHGQDPLRAAEATRLDAEWAVRDGRMTPGKAADILASHRLDWRLDGQEGALLLEQGRLEMAAQRFADACRTLREAERADPTDKADIDSTLGQALARLGDPSDAASISDQDFLSLSDEYADVLRADPGLFAKVEVLRAERFERLGLSGRGADALAVAAADTSAGPARGALELREAELRLEQGDLRATASVLRDAEEDGYPASMIERHAIIAASVLAGTGHLAAAIQALASPTSEAALELKARLLADAGDWPQSEAVLERLEVNLPPSGPLPAPSGDLVLRLATAAFRSGDETKLRDIDERYAQRMTASDEQVELSRLGRLGAALLPDKAPPAPVAGAQAEK